MVRGKTLTRLDEATVGRKARAEILVCLGHVHFIEGEESQELPQMQVDGKLHE